MLSVSLLYHFIKIKVTSTHQKKRRGILSNMHYKWFCISAKIIFEYSSWICTLLIKLREMKRIIVWKMLSFIYLTYAIISKMKLTLRIAHNGVLLMKSLPLYSFNFITLRHLWGQPLIIHSCKLNSALSYILAKYHLINAVCCEGTLFHLPQ